MSEPNLLVVSIRNRLRRLLGIRSPSAEWIEAGNVISADIQRILAEAVGPQNPRPSPPAMSEEFDAWLKVVHDRSWDD